MTLTIRYGGQQTRRTFEVAPTVQQLKSSQSLRGELGYGDNVRIMQAGSELPDYAQVNGPVVTVETAANQKANAA